jgi:hypothetical protein
MAITVPLVVGTASDDVIINFDFSAQPTPPPYTGTILSFFHLDVSAAPAKIIFDYYDGLNGVGLLGSDAAEPTVTTTGSVEAGPGALPRPHFARASSTGSFRSVFT